jgi:hypothetical protein
MLWRRDDDRANANHADATGKLPAARWGRRSTADVNLAANSQGPAFGAIRPRPALGLNPAKISTTRASNPDRRRNRDAIHRLAAPPPLSGRRKPANPEKLFS